MKKHRKQYVNFRCAHAVNDIGKRLNSTER
jgi:hypothetical protein